MKLLNLLIASIFLVGSYAQAVVQQKDAAFLLADQKCVLFRSVKATSDKNLIVLAECAVANGYQKKLFKISSAGALLWKQAVVVPTIQFFLEMAVDRENNIIVTGDRYPNLDGKTEAVAIKFSSSGAVLWEHRMTPNLLSDLTNDEYHFKSIAINGTDIYLAQLHFEFKSNQVQDANGAVKEIGNRYFSVSYLKLNAAGQKVWQQDEAIVDFNNPASSEDYSWLSSISQVTLTNKDSFPLEVVYKNGILYTQHGALRKTREASTGSLLAKATSPYFFGSLMLGQDGKLYSLGTNLTGVFHPMYNKMVVQYDDNFNQVALTNMILPPPAYSNWSGYVMPDALAIDAKGDIFTTGIRCYSTAIGCGAYVSKLGISGDVRNSTASPVWESTYNSSMFTNARGLSIVTDETSVYVGAHFAVDLRMKKGIMKFSK